MWYITCHAPNPTSAQSSLHGRTMRDVPKSVTDPKPKSKGKHLRKQSNTRVNKYMTKGINNGINKYSYNNNPMENLQILIPNTSWEPLTSKRDNGLKT